MKKPILLATTLMTALCVTGTPLNAKAAGNCSLPCKVTVYSGSTCNGFDQQQLYNMLENYLSQCYPNLQFQWQNQPAEGQSDCNNCPAPSDCNDCPSPADCNDCPAVNPGQPQEASPGCNTNCPVETPQPIVTPQPIESPQPVATPRPVETPQPTETPQPVVTPQPAETPQPVVTPRPTETPQPVKPEKTDTEPTVKQSYEEQVVALVNAERAKYGLPALKTNPTLQAAALARAKETVQLFSHTRPNGTSCFTVLKEYGISYRYAGENIAYGQRSPQEVVTAWMNSEGHRANILNKNFTTIGIGYYQTANGTKYWSQLFIS